MSIIDAREQFEKAANKDKTRRRILFRMIIEDMKASNERLKKLVADYKRKREEQENG